MKTNSTIRWELLASLLSALSLLSATAQTELANSGFESGLSSWTPTSSFYTFNNSARAHGGSQYAYFGVAANGTTPLTNGAGSIYQTVTIPPAATTVTLSFWLWVASDESTATAFDFLHVEILNNSGSLLGTPATYSNRDKSGPFNSSIPAYQLKNLSLLSYAGQTIRVRFRGTTDLSSNSIFRLDDISVTTIQNNGDPPLTVTPGVGTWIWANQNGDFSDSYNISSGTEVDVYAFMAEQTGSYVISTGGSLDSQLRIYNSSGTAITGIIDSAAGGETTTPSFASGSWYYIAVTGYQLTTGNYTLSVNGPNVPRTSITTAAPNYTGVVSEGIDYGGDLDYFQITAPSGTTSLDLIIGPTGFNTYGELYNSSGTLLTSFNTGGSGVVDVLDSYPVTAGATYYVGVSGINRTANGSFTFSVDFNPDQVIPTSFSGTVTDSLSGNPIPGATVSWNGYSTATAADGDYSLNNLPCATGTLTVSKNGYQTYSQSYAPPCYMSSLKNLPLTAIPLPMTIAGSVRYKDLDGTFKNAAYVYVEVREKDLLTDNTISQGYTDGSGNFAFTTDTQGNLIYNIDTGFGETGTRDIYFRIQAENETVKVSHDWIGNFIGIVYQFDSDTQYDVGGNFYSRSFNFSSTGATPNHAAAWGIPHSVKSAKDWLFQRTGWTRPQVSIFYPNILLTIPSRWPQFHPDGDFIEVPEDWKLNSDIPRNALEHEYGHAVHYSVRGDNLPGGSGEPHNIFSISSEWFALVEGWGIFFGSAVLNDPGIGSLEANDHWMGPNRDGSDHLGNVVEGAISSIFWDILDAASDDQVNNRFLDLWTVFLNDDPTSIWNSSGTGDFYHAWTRRFGQTRAVDEIFIDHGIPVTDDAYENNDVSASARLLTDLIATYPNLILADSADWFKFVTKEKSMNGSSVTINFVNQRGDLDFELYDGNMTLVGSSAGASDSETISMAGRAIDTYYVRVFGYRGDFSPNYSLNMALMPDVSSPALSITSHASGQSVSSGAITLSGAASDSGLGNNGISSVTIDGVRANNDTSTESQTANWYANVVLFQGANTFTVVAKDSSVNQNSTTRTIVINYIPSDTTAPAVAITFPANNATVTSASLTVTGTASDSGLGNNGVSSVTVNGVSASGGTASGANPANWSATITLNPGVNTITAVARDTYNNPGQQQITVIYNPPDTTAPAVSITLPANNDNVSSQILTVTGTASDGGRGNNGVSSVFVNGVSATGGATSGANTANWSATISLNPGVNTITAVAMDAFNNSGQQQITVTYNSPSDYTYTINNGTVTIMGYIGSGGAVTIPSSINGLPVTSIEGQAFAYYPSLTSVTIPNSVTSIGSGAFAYCYSLTSVTIGNSVTSIGSQAFTRCTSLSAITVDVLNSSYSSVDGVLFNKSQTTLIQCSGGKAGSYTVPNSVTSIGEWAFAHCTNLTSVTITDSVTTIGSAAFVSCASLTSVTIVGTVTNIGDWAFNNCNNLTGVTIPNSVTSIGYRAFSGCSGLTIITVDALNSFYSSVDGVLFNKSQTTLIQYPGGKAGSYTVPDSVTSIGDWAYAFCYGLTGVTIGNSVTSIGNIAFANCTSLTSVTIGNSVTSIGDETFASCSSLTRVTLPNSITSIKEGAFAYCTSLASVTIPTSVTSIGGIAFYRCTSLTGVYFQGDAPNIGSQVFDGDDNSTVYYLAGTTGWGPTFGGRPTALWNPLPEPPRQLTSMAMSNGVPRFVLNGLPGTNYLVQFSSNLVNWLPLSTHTISGSGSMLVTDPSMKNQPRRFYRGVPHGSLDIIIPATAGLITAPFVITNDSIHQPVQTLTVNGGRAAYTFTIATAGNYVVKGMVNAPNGATNSFFVNINAEPQTPSMIWDIRPFTSGFEQRTASWLGNGTTNSQFVPKVFNLGQGQHQLIIRGREAGVLLQSLTISPYP